MKPTHANVPPNTSCIHDASVWLLFPFPMPLSLPWSEAPTKAPPTRLQASTYKKLKGRCYKGWSFGESKGGRKYLVFFLALEEKWQSKEGVKGRKEKRSFVFIWLVFWWEESNKEKEKKRETGESFQIWLVWEKKAAESLRCFFFLCFTLVEKFVHPP